MVLYVFIIIIWLTETQSPIKTYQFINYKIKTALQLIANKYHIWI